MATSEHDGTVGEADITNFAEKLNAWTHDLTPAEQTLLNRLIERAASAEQEPADTRGHIIIVGGLPAGNAVLEAGQPSLLFRRAVGLSEISFVKKVDKSSPILY